MTSPSPEPGGRRDPRDRFSNLVADYDRGRPGYPDALFDAVAELGALDERAVIADVGAGTGISTTPFVRRGFRVLAVEPNAAMRAAAAERFRAETKVVVVDGSAEATGLAGGSVDLIFAAQAFHWFDVARARTEFRRIARAPETSVALVWNSRRSSGSPFVEEYERLLRDHGTDYETVGHRGVGRERLEGFFRGRFDARTFPNVQRLDHAGLRSRLLSSSYVPAVGLPGHEEMVSALDRLFAVHERAGEVELLYDCELWIGPLSD